ncbi:MAG: helix-turn-helix domain-containing protein [Limisphaerales bacterium]
MKKRKVCRRRTFNHRQFFESFALFVERHRKATGFSQAALAASAGLHQTYIGLLERRRRSPNLDTVQAIARSLGCMLSRLIIEAEKKSEEALTAFDF